MGIRVNLVVYGRNRGYNLKKKKFAFPKEAKDYPAWKETTDAMWKEIGTIADVVPESERC